MTLSKRERAAIREEIASLAERVNVLSETMGTRLEALRVQHGKTDEDIMRLDDNISVIAEAIRELPQRLAEVVGKNGTTTVPHLQALNGSKVVPLRGGRKGRKRQ